MVEASPQPRIVRFGPYEADLSTGELRRDGSKIALQEKPFQVLAVLLMRPGELVGREELRSRLWPSDTFIDFETGLNTVVRKLRQGLDDSAEEPQYVETLPKRGYRFMAPVAFEWASGPRDGSGSPEQVTAEATSSLPMAAAMATIGAAHAGRRRARWRLHAAWLAAVIGVAVLSPRVGPGDHHGTPPPNPIPVIVLMDSPLPGRVYDPRTFAAGGTNADDLTDALRDLPAVIEKENTSPMWHREAQILQQNPDLIVSHLSCLYDERVAQGQAAVLRPLFDSGVDRLLSLFAYVAAANPRTRFLIYSRGKFEVYGGTDKFMKDAQARFPVLQGRLHPWTVPGDRGAQTFRDPNTARLIRERVKATLQTR